MSTRINTRIGRGAAENNSRRSQGSFDRDPQSGATIRASTISFTNPDTISDSGNGFAALRAGDPIEVRGSARNSRGVVVVTAAAGSLTVRPAVVTSEAAGPSITINRE